MPFAEGSNTIFGRVEIPCMRLRHGGTSSLLRRGVVEKWHRHRGIDANHSILLSDCQMHGRQGRGLGVRTEERRFDLLNRSPKILLDDVSARIIPRARQVRFCRRWSVLQIALFV